MIPPSHHGATVRDHGEEREEVATEAVDDATALHASMMMGV
jgi:hypothetical protein